MSVVDSPGTRVAARGAPCARSRQGAAGLCAKGTAASPLHIAPTTRRRRPPSGPEADACVIAPARLSQEWGRSLDAASLDATAAHTLPEAACES